MSSKKVEQKVYTGFTPRSYQRAVIDCLKDAYHRHRIVTCVSRRQCGKSLLIENLLLYHGINFKKTTSICLSPTLNQARKVYKEIYEAICNSDVVKSSNATLLEITLYNDSQILFKSAEQKEALRGYTVNGILCIDEAAYISDDIFFTVLPWCDVKGAPILIVSTPRTRNGFFYTYYSYGKEGRKECFTIDWSDPQFKADLEKQLPSERLEEYRQMLPKNQFTSEYLGQFLDDDGMVFTHFKECVKTNNISPVDRLYVGIDWANGGDNDDTVLSIINQDGKQVYLQYWNNLSPTQQIERIWAVISQYQKQIDVIEPELNSIGTPYTDMLKEKMPASLASKVHGFNTTNASKADLVANLQVAFEQQRIEILDDPKQLSELGAYAAEYNPRTRNVSYNAPLGLHDDICIGLMLSYDAYKQRTARGVYSISVC